jgi:hypothetical protein
MWMLQWTIILLCSQMSIQLQMTEHYSDAEYDDGDDGEDDDVNKVADEEEEEREERLQENGEVEEMPVLRRSFKGDMKSRQLRIQCQRQSRRRASLQGCQGQRISHPDGIQHLGSRASTAKSQNRWF